MSDNNKEENLNKEADKSIELPEMPGKSVSEKSVKRSKRYKTKTKFYYSFLTVVLLFCLVQVGFGVILNVSKSISYRAKIGTLEKIRDNAETRNHDLKQEIKMFSSMHSLESIARNNLKMAGEDEVLVIINNNSAENNTHKKQKRKKWWWNGK